MEQSATPPDARPRSREIRLGLVMYGGISLAIYINGVAREFYRAVRGESVYKLIKAFTDSDIVVDVISGTSAGGVNGILLGYALCNKADFATTAALWRNAGDIGLLVRDPDKLDPPVLSILDGEGHYQEKLQEAFGRMGSVRDDGECEPSRLTEMDVFITSTDVDGRTSNWVDAQGHSVDVKDHRAVFQLKFRDGRKNDFEPDESGTKSRALGKLARMTSCFPAAFPPVRVNVSPTPQNAAEAQYQKEWGTADALIARWGGLTKPDSYFLDGGLLDNKPFTHTIREIFYRLADRAVERKLFYVEPDPERFSPDQPATQVNAAQAVQRALISIPGYESIADDLKLLSARNEKIFRYRRLIGQGREGLSAAAERAREALDPESIKFILRSRAISEGKAPAAASGGQSRYAMARFVTLSERAVRGILKSSEQQPRVDPAQAAAATALFRMFDQAGSVAASYGDETLYRFDVYFRLRRMFHVLYACPDPGLEREQADKLRGRVLRAIGLQISLLEIIQAAMEKFVDDGEFGWRERPPEVVWARVLAGYQQLLHVEGDNTFLPRGYEQEWGEGESEECLDQSALNQVHQSLFGAGGAAAGSVPDGRLAPLMKELASPADIAAPIAFVSAFSLTDAFERRMLRLFDREAERLPAHSGLPGLEKTYDDFIYIDADLFTLEVFADLQEKDVINTVRISPRDAQRALSQLDLKRKVAGDAVFHFGGFFKKSWRANDILWGRLDGLCQLTESLFERERVLAVLDNGARRAVLQQEMAAGGALDLERLFPKALQDTRDELSAWFKCLVDNDPAKRNKAAAQDEWGKHLDLLVEAAQMEFLGEEVRNVLTDSVQEQMEWNLYRGTAGTLADVGHSGRGTEYALGNGRFDPSVHALAAQAISGRAMESLDNPKSLKAFFLNDYGVGAESIAKDVPQWVLLEILFRALLVANAGVLQSLPAKWRDNVSQSLPFKAVSATLWLLYRLASTLRSSGRMLLAWRSVVLGLAMLSWCVAFFWGQQLLCDGASVSRLAVMTLFAPTVLLFGSFSRLWPVSAAIAALGAVVLMFGSPACKWLTG